ncbi:MULTISPECIES: hypothetical protein [Paraburkholderia]|uniref:hypothetical protein n=1 Tax=Paraburkholderia TaxID=1822464 RepID=UPI001019EAB0|nr:MULTISPECIES: hypothetical protein [Paraburkholderia]
MNAPVRMAGARASRFADSADSADFASVDAAAATKRRAPVAGKPRGTPMRRRNRPIISANAAAPKFRPVSAPDASPHGASHAVLHRTSIPYFPTIKETLLP